MAFVQSQPLYWREALLCVPAVPCLLLAGISTGQIAYGAVAAGAAFAVGFGAARDLRGRRWGAMIAATFGTSLAALVGSLTGQWPAILVGVAAVSAGACAVLALLDEDLWWVSLQMLIALLVGGYFAGPPGSALERSAAVFLGGAAQVAVVVVLARVAPRSAARLPAGPPKPAPSTTLLLAHSTRAAICVGMSLEAARALDLANNYWAPMTAMLVLKPGLGETRTRGAERLSGTLAGCLIATLFAFSVDDRRAWLLAGVAASAGAAFALQKAHYALLSCAITSTVVLLLSTTRGGGALANAEHRLAATLLGGGIALLVAMVLPHRPTTSAPAADHVGT